MAVLPFAIRSGARRRSVVFSPSRSPDRFWQRERIPIDAFQHVAEVARLWSAQGKTKLWRVRLQVRLVRGWYSYRGKSDGLLHERRLPHAADRIDRDPRSSSVLSFVNRPKAMKTAPINNGAMA